MKRVYISYSWSSDEHRARVVALVYRLRRGGADVLIDVPAPQALADADVVLAVCSEPYRRAFEGHGDPSRAEDAAIAAVASSDAHPVLPVLLDDGASQFVPLALRTTTPLYLPEQLPQLLRMLGATAELTAPPPPLATRWPVEQADEPVSVRRGGGFRSAGAPSESSPDVMRGVRSGSHPAAELRSRMVAQMIANLRQGGTQDFFGRRFELAALHNAFSGSKDGNVVVLIGAPGIGKTALALQYALRQLDDYDVVWLVHAQSELRIRSDLAQLSHELGLVAPGNTDEQADVLAVRHWLTNHERWLLIFDEAAGAELIAPFVPTASRGHVIVTSRGGNWRGFGKETPLGALARDEAIHMMQSLGLVDVEAANDLAARLEGSPLAIQLACGVIRQRGPGWYLRELDGPTMPRSSQRLGEVLEAALDGARRRSPAIGAFLELIAYLAPDDIPISLLREHVDSLPPELSQIARDDDALARLLAELVALSLITHDDSSIAVHPAIQAAARGTAHRGAAVVLLDAAFFWDADRPDTWAAAEAVLSHALAAIEDPYAALAAPGALQRVLERTAACLWKRGELATAIEHQRRASELAVITGTGAKPGVTPDNAHTFATLGGMLREVGDLTAAAATLELLRDLLASSPGPNRRDTVAIRRELARVAMARGELDAAREQLELALALDRDAPDREAPLSAAVTLSDLSKLEVELGRIDAAAELLEQALALQRKVLDTDAHPLVAATLRQSAAILLRRNEPAAARVRLEQALEILRGPLKTDQPLATVDVMNELASVLVRLGDTHGAQRLLEQTLEIHARLFGGTANLNGAAIEYNLASTLILHGDNIGARRHVERALAGLEGQGLSHYATAAALTELLGQLDIMAGDYLAARACFERALEVRTAPSAPMGPETIQTQVSLAQVLVKLGATDEAMTLVQPIRDGMVATLATHVQSGASEALFVLADVLSGIGEAVGARDLLRSVFGALAGTDPLATARGTLVLARIQLQLDEVAEARHAAREAHATFVAALGRGSPADGSAALLRAEIELRCDDPVAAFGLAAAAARAFRDRDDAFARANLGDALGLAGRAAAARRRPRTAAALFVRALEHRDSLATRNALFDLIEALAAAGGRTLDRGAAVALLARLAPGWLADRITAGALLRSAEITDHLEVSIALAGPAAGAAIASRDGYGWRLELAPIRADNVASEVRYPSIEAAYAGDGQIVFTAPTADLPWGTYLLTLRFVDSPRDAWRADVTVSNVEAGNPFLAGPPASGERFFGRARLLQDLLGLVEHASLVLLGPRRSGKTSVLYRFAELCGPAWTVIPVDLHNYVGMTDHELMRELASDVARALGFAAPTGDQPFQTLRHALGTLRTQRVLLLLDEIAILAGCPDTAIQLRAMSKWRTATIRIVMAGTYRDLDRLTACTDLGSSPVNEFINRELGQLTREEARSLLEQPVLGRYRYEVAALDQLLELGAGRPFFLNALAYLTLEVVRQDGGRTITAAHVDAARREASSYLAGRYHELVRELDALHRDALPAIITTGGKTSGPQAHAVYNAGIAIGSRFAAQLDPIFIEWWRARGVDA